MEKMPPENKSHSKQYKNLLDSPQSDTKEEERHLKKVYQQVDQIFMKKALKKWNFLISHGIMVTKDEDEITFEFQALWKRIKMKGKCYLKVIDQKGSFRLLKYWLPPSIEVKNIWPNEEAVNDNKLGKIIQHINKEVRAFHSRSEQLRELENGSKPMKLQIFSPQSRKMIKLKTTLSSEDKKAELVYSLILQYKSTGCLPFDVLLESDNIPKEDTEALLQQASVFKKMFLWQAFCKYTFYSDGSVISSGNGNNSMELEDTKNITSSQLQKSKDTNKSVNRTTSSKTY